jgi:acyl carrier protein
MLHDVLEELANDDFSINEDTTFVEELDLNSIEFIIFTDLLKSKYGAKINFTDWLSRKEINEIIQLRVGDLAEFIDHGMKQGGMRHGQSFM